MLLMECRYRNALLDMVSLEYIHCSPGYNGGAKERQFNILFCRASTIINTCCYTSYLNAWDGAVNFRASSSYIIPGIFSYHDKFRERK